MQKFTDAWQVSRMDALIFFNTCFFALSHSRNLPCGSKFLHHFKFGKVEFVHS